MDRGWVPGGSRRRLLKAGIGLAALSLCSTAAAADQNWQTFKRRFVVDDRRVIDSGNNNVSHSESQGWGLLFAQSYDDKETFAKIWDWTSKSLQRGDGLFSWRWSPNTNDPVPDKNNAADGDILIAWALARAAAKWNEPRWLQPSRRIQSAVLDRLAVEFQGRLILLPGAQGFARGNRYVVNLSYYVWPAIHDFAEHAGDQGRWRRLEADGLWLLDNAAFGDYRLPPDWLLFGNQAFRVADDWKPYFGFDAIRIPLYLAWHNQASRLGRFVTAWRTPRLGGARRLDQSRQWRGGAVPVQRRLCCSGGGHAIRGRRRQGGGAGCRNRRRRRLLFRQPQAAREPRRSRSAACKTYLTGCSRRRVA